MPDYKVLVVESGGSEFAFQTELALASDNVSFVSPSGNLQSTDNQSAIEEANHYSWRRVAAAVTKVIPVDQQMVIWRRLTIENGAHITLKGGIVIL